MSHPRRRCYGRWARTLIALVERGYGSDPSLEQLHALEVLCINAYRACEWVATVALAVAHSSPAFAGRLAGFIQDLRDRRAEEGLHCQTLERLMGVRGVSAGRGARVAQQVLAAGCFRLTGLLFVVNAARASRAGADLEDHLAWTYWAYATSEDALQIGPEGVATLCQIAAEKDRPRRADLALSYVRLIERPRLERCAQADDPIASFL